MSTGAWVAIIVAFFGSIPGLVALIKSFGERPRAKADAMALINQRALETMGRIDADATQVRTRLEQIDTKLVQTRKELDLAREQIDAMEDREERFRRALRLIVQHVNELTELARDHGAVTPPHPITQKEIDELLAPPR